MSSKSIIFRAPEFIMGMIDHLQEHYKCNRSELFKLLITNRYHELRLEELKNNNNGERDDT